MSIILWKLKHVVCYVHLILFQIGWNKCFGMFRWVIVGKLLTFVHVFFFQSQSLHFASFMSENYKVLKDRILILLDKMTTQFCFSLSNFNYKTEEIIRLQHPDQVIRIRVLSTAPDPFFLKIRIPAIQLNWNRFRSLKRIQSSADICIHGYILSKLIMTIKL